MNQQMRLRKSDCERAVRGITLALDEETWPVSWVTARLFPPSTASS